MKSAQAAGAYVHWPWCRIRCPYCAFLVSVDAEAPWSAYTDALLEQHRALQPAYGGPPATLFFGGGTPSLVPASQLARIIEAVAPRGEVSLEANPEDVTEERLQAWLRSGVTRLSLGIQSYDADTALPLGRRSKVARHREVTRLVADAGFSSWSVDLIFAVPGQTADAFARDLDTALGFEAPHVSLYGLTEHPGTPYTRAVRAGRMVPPDDEHWSRLWELAEVRLEQSGVHRYEVSNFARPGHRCRHNERIWRGAPYLGLGVGAHGLLPDGRRTVGGDDATAFAEAPDWTIDTIPDPPTRALDYLIASLRHVDGVDLAVLAERGGSLAPEPVDALVAASVVQRTSVGIALHGRGWRIADGVLNRLAAALGTGPPGVAT